ncbi:Hypothetical protein CINCED_3A023597 [Cinara cedri]|uniref:Uncharacterized protein n=1 Tax=Cinara cedri TaxID=506608 RepID=A0A5E4NNX5_9HEMI|nr:Hypothetical protein CINCED_3A023597 [Cinara cedri]
MDQSHKQGYEYISYWRKSRGHVMNTVVQEYSAKRLCGKDCSLAANASRTVDGE